MRFHSSHRLVYLSVTHLILPDGQRPSKMYLKQTQFIAQLATHQIFKAGKKQRMVGDACFPLKMTSFMGKNYCHNQYSLSFAIAKNKTKITFEVNQYE